MQASIVRRVAVAVFAATFVATAVPAVAADDHDHAGPANFDARADDAPARVAPATKQARAALETALGEDADVRVAPSTGAVTYVGSPLDLLTGPAKGDPADLVLDYVREHGEVFGLGKADVAALRVVARSTSPDGVTHVRFNQVLDGIQSYDSGIEGHVAANGALINVSGGAVPGAKLPTTTPKLGAAASLGEARDAVDGSGLPSAVDATKGGVARETTFTSGETARLRWLATADGPTLVWQVTVDGADEAMFTTLVDATDGDVLVRTGLSHDAGFASYYRSDPDQTPVPTSLTMPAAWYDDHAGGTRLWGQYARTYEDFTKVNPAPGAEGGNPQVASSNGSAAAPDWAFTRVANAAGTPCPASGCSWNSADTASRATNFRQVATNVHVLTSRFHDHLATGAIGFDEASGNFQRTNASGAGLGNDYVRVEVNDGNGYNNANMSTPPDGEAPRMQMYLWNTRDTNGSEQADIVYHEYGHGLSNRLVVNAAGASDITTWQSRMMGEAWSDFYALDLLVAEGSLVDTATVGDLQMAKHVLHTNAPFKNGIRSEAIDCPANVTGIAACTGASANGAGSNVGGYTYGDLAAIYAGVAPNDLSPHAGSEIFAQTLWQLRGVVGRDAALALVTGGMRLSGAAPSMLDMRDAILQQAIAMRSAPNAANDYSDEVWTVFASRGMGASATTPSSNAFSASEAFNVPAVLLRASGPATITDPYPGGDADGIVEAGEQLQVTTPLANMGLATATSIVGTIASPSAAVTVDRATAAWADLQRGTGGTPTQPFLVRTAASCTSSTTLTITTTSNGAPATSTATVDPRPSWRGNVPIVDGTGAEAVSVTQVPFAVSGSGTITDLDMRIGELRHTYPGDLVIKLQHPDGTTAVLLNRPAAKGYSGDDIIDAIFDSQAAGTIPTSQTATTPITGRMKPAVAASLTAFNGKSIAGTWTLVVEDWYDGDAGSVRAIGVDAPQQDCSRAEIPITTTGDAAPVTHDSATVSGTVDPNGRATGMRIAYGTTTSYGSVSGIADAGAGIGAQPFGAVLANLSPNTTYHYRIEAIREGGVLAVVGNDRTFTTGSIPVIVPPALDQPSAPSTPVKVVGGPIGALGGADKVAPSFLGKVVPVILPTVKGKAKVAFGLKLSEAATVKVAIAKSTPGVKVGTKCLAKKPGRSGKACVLLTPAGTTTKALASGGSTLAAGSLKPGTYVATITATDAAKNASKPITVKFTVKAAAPKPKR